MPPSSPSGAGTPLSPSTANFDAAVQKRAQLARNYQVRQKLCVWTFAFVVVAFESWVMEGSVLDTLCFGYLRELGLLGTTEAFLLAYIALVMMYLLALVAFPFLDVSSLLSSHTKSQEHPPRRQFHVSPLLTSTPGAVVKERNFSALDWISGFRFGLQQTPSLVYRGSPSPKQSPNTSSAWSPSAIPSPVGIALPTTAVHGISLDSLVPVSVSPRSIDSIHTEEQLARLLRRSKDEDSFHRASAASSPFASFLESPVRVDPRPYQLSEEIKNDNGGTNTSVLHISPSGRVRLNVSSAPVEEDSIAFRVALNAARPLSNSPSTAAARKSLSPLHRRRSSHSSPERATSGSTSTSTALTQLDSALTYQLSEADFTRGERRLRVWISNTIITPLKENIDAMNKLLETEFGSLHLRIGISSVDSFRLALTSKPELANTQLPYLLPYIAVHSNQAYLVSRINTLAKDPALKEFRWNGGGPEPVHEGSAAKGSAMLHAVGASKASFRPWGEHLPTDSQLIFGFICAYVDSRLTTRSVVGAAVEQPFSFAYTLAFQAKPNSIQSLPDAFYINVLSEQPPLYCLEVCSVGGSRRRVVGAREDASNLWRTLLLFLQHCRLFNSNRLDHLSLGPTGINISCVLESSTVCW